jgi:hypothetical protein
LRRQAQQLVARRDQAGMAEIAAVFHFQVEAGGVAQFLHRRRHQGEDLRVAGQHGKNAPHGAAVAMAGRRFLPGPRSSRGFRWVKAMPVFWPAPAKAEARDGKDEIDIVLLVVRKWWATCSPPPWCGWVARGGQGDQGDDKALVLDRAESRWAGAQNRNHQHRHDAGIASWRPGMAQRPNQIVAIAFAKSVRNCG